MNHSFQYLVCIELYWYKDQGKNILLRSQSNSINNMTFIELLMRSIHSKICLVIFGYHVQLSNNYTFFIDRIPMLKTWSEIQWNSNCLVRIYTWVRFYYLYLANSFIKIIWIIHLSFIYDYSLQNKKQKNNVQGNEARLWNTMVRLPLVMPSIINVNFWMSSTFHQIESFSMALFLYMPPFWAL